MNVLQCTRSTSFPPLINWPFHRTFPKPSSLCIPLSCKKIPHSPPFFFILSQAKLFYSFFYIYIYTPVCPNHSFFSRKPFKPIYQYLFFSFSKTSLYPLIPPLFFFFNPMFILFYFLRVIAFGFGRGKMWGRTGIEFKEWRGWLVKKRDEGDGLDGRTPFCISSPPSPPPPMAILMCPFFYIWTENIKSFVISASEPERKWYFR